MKMKNRSKIAAAVFTLGVLVACSSKSDTKTEAPTQVRLNGTVDGCVFTSGGCTAAASQALLGSNALALEQSGLEGRVLVLAVGSNANVYQGATQDDGGFSVQVAAGLSYVVMFRDSAGRFLGTLILNDSGAAQALRATNNVASGSGVAFKMAKDLDLGIVKIDTTSKTATSSNEQALLANAESSSVKDPSDVTYTGSTTWVSFSLYHPIVEGMIVVSKGYGDCTPGNACANELRIEKVTTEWNEALGRDVIVQWRYRCDSSNSDACESPALNDKGYSYLTETEFCLLGTERSDGFHQDGGCGSDIVELGTGPLLRADPAAVFPDFDAAARPALLLRLEEGGLVKYNWFAKGVGEMLILDADYLPTARDETEHVRMRALCTKIPVFDSPGTYTVAGTCPGWATDSFVTALPATFPGH